MYLNLSKKLTKLIDISHNLIILHGKTSWMVLKHCKPTRFFIVSSEQLAKTTVSKNPTRPIMNHVFYQKKLV